MRLNKEQHPSRVSAASPDTAKESLTVRRQDREASASRTLNQTTQDQRETQKMLCDGSKASGARRRKALGRRTRRKEKQDRMYQSSSAQAQLTSGQDEQAFMQVKVPPHPLIKHWVGVVRSAETPPPVFKATLVELGRLLLYEATRDWLETVSMECSTPAGSTASVELIDTREPVRIVPIMRAGLALAEPAPSVLPLTAMHHLGFKRNESSLEPEAYLDALPSSISDTCRVVIVDPVLATGGTASAAIERVKHAGAREANIRVVSANVSSAALQRLSEQYKKLQVFTASVDEEVSDDGMVLPGLGDAGDRAFNSPI